MPRKTPHPLFGYFMAVAAIGVAIAVRYALTPWLGTTFPLATMFTAIAFVVWRAGAAPAFVTALGGWAASGYVFRGGINYFGGMTFNELVGLLLYLLAVVPIIVLGHSMRVAQRKLEERHQELSATNLALASKIEAQSLLAAIVASSEDAIISKTLDGVITSWNKGAEKLLGWAPIMRSASRFIWSSRLSCATRSGRSSSACATAIVSSSSTSSAFARTARAYTRWSPSRRSTIVMATSLARRPRSATSRHVRRGKPT